MCDQSYPTDQLDLANSPLYTRELELESILKLCFISSEAFNSRFSSSITSHQSFFLKLLGDYSGLERRVISFWADSSLYNSINPAWEANISSKAYNKINSEPENPICYMYYLIDLMKGRFKILQKCEDYYIIEPLYSNKNSLFSILVAEQKSTKYFKILVGLKENEAIEKSIFATKEEFCAYSRKLQILNSLESEIILIENEFKPSYFCIKDKELTNEDFSKENIEILQELDIESIQKPEEEKIQPEVKEIVRKCKTRDPNPVASPRIRASPIASPKPKPRARLVLAGIEHTKSALKGHNHRRSCLVEGSSINLYDSNSSLSIHLNSLKEKIETNLEFYLSKLNLSENYNGKWASIILTYLERQQSTQLTFDLFSELNLKWKICIEKDLLNALKELTEQKFLLYLDKILKFSKGEVIENYNEYLEINRRISPNFILAPIIIRNKNLRPILSVLCIEISRVTQDCEYRLKLIEFYSTETLGSQIENFKNSGKYFNIEEVWQFPSIILLISVIKQQELIPTYPIGQISFSRLIKKLFFLCYLPKVSLDYNFYIKTSRNETISSTKQILEDTEDDLIPHIIQFQVGLSPNTNFLFKLKKKLRLNIFCDFSDNSNRSIKDAKYQFFFDLNFMGIPIFNNRNNSNINIQDPYHHLLLYLDYFSKHKTSDELEFLISSIYDLGLKNIQITSFDIQHKIVLFVNSVYLKNMYDKNIKELYLSLSILGLIKNFDAIINGIEQECLKKIIGILENQDNCLETLKLKKNYHLALKGLSKFFLLAKINKMSNINHFNNITDLDSIYSIVIEYLLILKANKKGIEVEEIDKILDYIKNFQRNSQKKVINLLLESKIALNQLARLLLHPLLKYITIVRKKEIFMKALDTFTVDLKDLLKFLEFTKANNEFYAQNIISKMKIAKFIDNHLKGNNNIIPGDFSVIGGILGIFHSENYCEDEVLKKVIKIQILKFGFRDCADLFLFVPNLIPGMFKEYITRIWNGPVKLESLQLVENTLELFPNDFQETVILNLFGGYSELNLKKLVEVVYKTDSLIFKKCYKKVFKNKLLDETNEVLYSETFDYMNRIKDNPKNSDNYILFELLNENPMFFSVSYQDLYEDIIKNPKPKKKFKKIIKNQNKLYHQKYVEEIISFILQITDNIITKQMDLKTFKMILKQCNAQSSIFFDCVQDALNNSFEYENFKLSFLKIKEEVIETTENLRQFKKIIYSPILNIPEISQVLKDYEWLLSNSDQINIEEYILKNKLLNLDKFLKFPFKSRIFKNCVYREVLKSDMNLEFCVESAYNLIENFLISIRGIGNKGFTLEEIEVFVQSIESEDSFNSEIMALCQGFPNACEQESNINQTLGRIFTDFIIYKDSKQLITLIYTSYSILGLPLQLFDKYVINNSDYYSEYFSCALNELKSEKLSSFNSTQLFSLTLFFNEINENQELIISMNSINEFKKNLWYENFDETKDIKLSLDILNKFSVIWSFLNEIKKSTNDLTNYLKKILELLENNENSCIIEYIKKCSFEIEPFLDFNNSIDTQDYINYSKIKMIHSDSRLKIRREKNYLAEIYPKIPDEGYNSSSINSNELSFLMDRALQSKRILEQRKSMNKLLRTQDLKMYSEFISYTNVLKEYLIVLNQLGNSVYEDLLEEVEYYIKDGDFNKLEEDKGNKNEVYKYWAKSFEEAKEQCHVLNTLNDEIICLVDKFLYDRSQENLDQISWVFRYANKKPPSVLNTKISPPTDIKVRLMHLVNFLNALRELRPSFKFPPHSKLRIRSQGSILLANTEEFYRALLSIYYNYYNTIPRPDLVLFCNHSTDRTELKRFFNRCALSTKNEIYTLVNPENLSLENEKIFDLNLNVLLKKEQPFSLAIVTNNMNSKLISNLSFKPLVRIEKIDNLILTDKEISNLIENIAKNFLVVTSTFVGLGKSKLIKK